MKESGERVLFFAVKSTLRHWVVVVVEDDHFLAHAFVGSDVEFLVVFFVLVVNEIRLGKHPALANSPAYLDAQLVDLVSSKKEVVLLVTCASS